MRSVIYPILVFVSVWLLASSHGAVVVRGQIAGGGGAERIVYVSPTGNDGWSGGLADALKSPTGEDGPLRTLVAARDRVRGMLSEQRSGKAPAATIRVRLRGGMHVLAETLVLTPEDSGINSDHPVIYEAYPNERPIISGGTPLPRWENEKAGSGSGSGVWRVGLTGGLVAAKFRHLYVGRDGWNEERRYRPCAGPFVIAGLTDEPTKPGATQAHAQSQKTFIARSGDLGAWVLAPDVELVVLHDWSLSRMRVGGWDESRRIVTMTSYPQYRVGHWWRGGRNPYYFENVRGEFRNPGEFYADFARGELLYRPVAGETQGATRAVAPRLATLVKLAGEPTKNRRVAHLQFRGLSFRHTNVAFPADGYKTGQAAVDLAAAFEAVGAQGVTIEDCGFSALGGYAVSLGAGCMGNRVLGNRMTDLGGGGVKVGVTDRRAKPEVLPTGNRIGNNLIAGGSRDTFSATAVWVGIAAENVVDHNRIDSFLYTGISQGWCWDDKPSVVRNNRVENNWITNTMLLLADGGGIYTLGNQPGSRLAGNRIEDVHRSEYAGRAENNGIFFDEGTSELTVSGNAIRNTANAVIRFNQSRREGNVFERNSFAGLATDALPWDRTAGQAGLEPAVSARLGVVPKVALPPLMQRHLPPPAAFREDFEGVRIDSDKGFPADWKRQGTTLTAGLTVVAGPALSGRQSLKITDDRTPTKAFFPLLIGEPPADYGDNVEFGFALRWEAGATLNVEARDYASAGGGGAYRTGPQCRIQPDGSLMVGRQRLMRLEPGIWHRFRLQYHLKSASRPMFTLIVASKPEGARTEKTHRFERLPFASGATPYRKLGWLGFISDGTPDRLTTIYLDDLYVDARRER